MYRAETWPCRADLGCCMLEWGHPVLTGTGLLHTGLDRGHLVLAQLEV